MQPSQHLPSDFRHVMNASTSMRARQQISLFGNLEAAHTHFVEEVRQQARKSFSAFIQPLCDARGLSFHVINGRWFFQPITHNQLSIEKFNQSLADSASVDADIDTAMAVLNHPVPGMNQTLGEMMESYDPLARSARHYLTISIESATGVELNLLRDATQHMLHFKLFDRYMETSVIKQSLINHIMSKRVDDMADQGGALHDIHDVGLLVKHLNKDLRVNFSRDFPTYSTGQKSKRGGYCIDLSNGAISYI